MRVALSWLCDFAPFPTDPTDLASTLDDLGMVVEGIERVGADIDEVVVARVLSVEVIPKAQKIRLVHVDQGSGDDTPVVCGAWNFGAGDLVAFAPVGTVLPGGLEIGRRTIRGVESHGMICSPRELALGDDHEGILVLPPGPAPGTPLVDALGLTRDVVFDLAIEGNRPDALSVAGVARDSAARLRLPFTLPDPVPISEADTDVAELATVAVLAPELCPRFTARAITAVRVGPSRPEIARRLTLAGMRPINNVVDASNYVMLDLGQPTHPYDLARLPGRGLLVRRAEPGERLVTLDGVERRLGDGDDCLICDAEGRPVGIGGIMGGASSEISPGTSEVLLEAAYFTPMAIARTAKRLNLRTEASARFERGCDPWGIDRAVGRFLEVLGTGEVASGMLDEQQGLPSTPRITVRTRRVNAILGTDLSDEQVEGYLRPIGFDARVAGAGVHEVRPPTFRPDVEDEIDVIEEVGRHHGYSRIARTVPRSSQVGRLTPYQRERRRVRDVLVGAGVDEALTTALLGPGDHERAGLSGEAIRAANPLMQEESVLRTSLRPGLLRALSYNAARRLPEVRFFEIGHVFLPRPAESQEPGRDAHLPLEPEHLGVALAGDGSDAVAAKQVWDVLAGALRLADVSLEAARAPGLHPGRTVRARASGLDVGLVGEIEPSVVSAWGLEGRVGWIEVDLERLLSAPRRPQQQQPISRFPSSDIDLAFVVDESVPAGDVERTLREAGGDLLVDLRLFDVYRGSQMGPGERSLAFRLRFCALDRTLTDDDLAVLRGRCIEAVEGAHGAILRG